MPKMLCNKYNMMGGEACDQLNHKPEEALMICTLAAI